MAWPLRILAAGALLGGLVTLAPLEHLIHVELWDVWGSWLDEALADYSLLEDQHSLAYVAAGAGIVAMLVGIGAAWNTYAQRGVMPAIESRGFHKVLMNKWYVDEVYDFLIVRRLAFVAMAAGYIDKYFVDGILAKLTALEVKGAGWLFTRAQTGLIYAYGAVMVAGVLGLTWWFTYPHPQLDGQVTNTTVQWTAARGMGYGYRWDLDDDGEWDVGDEDTFVPDQSAPQHTYDVADWRGVAVVIEAIGRVEATEVVLAPGETFSVPEIEMAESWARPDGSGLPPTFRALENDSFEVVFLPNGAGASVAGTATQDEQRLSVGDSVQVGGRSIRIGAVVRGRVEVESAFGNVARDDAELIILPPRGAGVGDGTQARVRVDALGGGR